MTHYIACLVYTSSLDVHVVYCLQMKTNVPRVDTPATVLLAPPRVAIRVQRSMVHGPVHAHGATLWMPTWRPVSVSSMSLVDQEWLENSWLLLMAAIL